jgi:hypothetical protein
MIVPGCTFSLWNYCDFCEIGYWRNRVKYEKKLILLHIGPSILNKSQILHHQLFRKKDCGGRGLNCGINNVNHENVQLLFIWRLLNVVCNIMHGNLIGCGSCIVICFILHLCNKRLRSSRNEHQGHTCSVTRSAFGAYAYSCAVERSSLMGPYSHYVCVMCLKIPVIISKGQKLLTL